MESKRRQHFVVTTAGLVDGFVKNRAFRQKEIERFQNEEKFRLGKQVTELMQESKLMPKNASSNEQLSLIVDGVIAEESCKELGSAEKVKKFNVDVHEQVLNAKSCFRLVPRGLNGRKRKGAHKQVAHLDFSYGVTTVQNLVKNTERIRDEEKENHHHNISPFCHSKTTPKHYNSNIDGNRHRPQSAIDLVTLRPAKRQRKRRKVVLPPKIQNYTTEVRNGYEYISNQIYDQKTANVDDQRRHQKEIEHLEAGLEQACINTNTFEGMKRFKQLEETKTQKRLERELERAAKEAQVIDTNEGEKNLMEFIRRLQEGVFFYQTEQLFFEGFQQIFMKKMISTLAPSIVGKSWSAIAPRLCKQYGWTPEDFNMVVCGNAPRRMGKSVAVSVMALNYALSMKGPCEITIFSTCGRVSGFLHEKIKDILFESGYGAWLDSIGAEYIYLKDPNDPNGHIKKIFSYPSNPKISISFIILCVFSY